MFCWCAISLSFLGKTNLQHICKSALFSQITIAFPIGQNEIANKIGKSNLGTERNPLSWTPSRSPAADKLNGKLRHQFGKSSFPKLFVEVSMWKEIKLLKKKILQLYQNVEQCFYLERRGVLLVCKINSQMQYED